MLNLQRHFGQANKDIEQIIVSSDKISKRSMKIGQLDLDEETVDSGPSGPKLVAG